MQISKFYAPFQLVDKESYTYRSILVNQKLSAIFLKDFDIVIVVKIYFFFKEWIGNWPIKWFFWQFF